jgi:hypothetical protein
MACQNHHALHAAIAPCSPSVRSVPRVLVPAWKNAAALRFRWALGSGHFSSPAVPLNTSRQVPLPSLRQRPNRSELLNPVARNFHAHTSAAPMNQTLAGSLNGRTICGRNIKNGTAQSRRGRARDSKAPLWVAGQRVNLLLALPPSALQIDPPPGSRSFCL